MTYCILMLALLIADVMACVRAAANTVLVVFGRSPEKCRRTCLLIMNRQTMSTCGNPCCLPPDHGAVWNHTCTEHVRLGGRVSSFEYRTFMLIRWWQRVLSAITSAFRLASRTVWKWGMFKYALGALVLALLYTLTATPTPRGSRSARLQPGEFLDC